MGDKPKKVGGSVLELIHLHPKSQTRGYIACIADEWERSEESCWQYWTRRGDLALWFLQSVILTNRFCRVLSNVTTIVTKTSRRRTLKRQRQPEVQSVQKCPQVVWFVVIVLFVCMLGGRAECGFNGLALELTRQNSQFVRSKDQVD